MASILDQYELESSRPGTLPSLDSVVGTHGSSRREMESEPIFRKVKKEYKRPDPIRFLTVCNKFLVMAMGSNVLIRIDMAHPDQQDEIELPKALEDKIYKLFQDPTGRHVIISMEQSSEIFYLSRNSKKPRSIPKLKGHLVNAVGWNWQNVNDNTTGAILLGTSKGVIFETDFSTGDDNRIFGRAVERYVTKLFVTAGKKSQPITGLEFDRMPTENSNSTEYKYYILVTTPSRLYQFIGIVLATSDSPMFQPLFQTYLDKPEEFLELPHEFGTSELRLYAPTFRNQAKAFAWMAGPGIYYGDIDVDGAAGPNSVTANVKLMSYPEDGETKTNPLSIILTEFHVLILFTDRVKAVCLLNEQLIFDDPYPEYNLDIRELSGPEKKSLISGFGLFCLDNSTAFFQAAFKLFICLKNVNEEDSHILKFGKLLGMYKDPITNSIWAYTSQHIFNYKVNQESRDVWRIYLDKGKFDLAKEYCKNNPANLDQVLTKEAEHLFEEKRYEESAIMYANTQSSFEEISLKFINLENKDPLSAYLTQKLNALRPQDRTQMTMLVTWLTEIYLNQLGELKEQGLEKTEKFFNVQDDFCKFLNSSKIKECVSNNRQVIYDLISSHGDIEDLMYFARLMADFERVINHYIQHEYYQRALEILTEQDQIELYYKFSPVLIQHIPHDTVNAWKKQRDRLQAKRLIPSLVQYDSKKHHQYENEAIRYLKYCVEELNVKDSSIHNYLLSLYARTNPDQLRSYLEVQGQDPDCVCYDLKYALRLCLELNHKEACVHIYSVMGLYEEAVELALTVNVDLAKEQAAKPDEDDVDMRKKLWLQIARHVVEEKKDVKRAMEFLKECDLLKIEDILPFFHDFVIIDDFKDAIIASLEKYNEHIDSLKEEMDRATKSAEEIRKEIQSFRNKFAFVKAQDKCYICKFPLMTQAFYVFPCEHKFHRNCLISEVIPNLPTSKRKRVEELQKKLNEPGVQNLIFAMHLQSSNENLKGELEEIIGAECIYCGEMMIKLIDKPFIEPDEMDQAASGWL